MVVRDSHPFLVLILCSFLSGHALATAVPKPHVVMIVADDLGFNDVSWNNRVVQTPNLNKLAQEGVILNRSYAQPTCTPSRSAYLTGRYPFKLGTQHGPFGHLQPAGLPTRFSLLPHYLREVGYKTHLVGKWHLGFCKDAYMPTKRGFDTHYGFLTGYEDYNVHNTSVLTDRSINGIDFRDNMKPLRFRQYSTYAYSERVSKLIGDHNSSTPFFLMYSFQAVHTPMQVPRRFYDMYANLSDPRRRIHLGQMTALDEAVGVLVRDLKKAKMFDNTIFIFTSDNGGKQPHTGASNFPLRGYKDSLWEGGVRVAGFIYSKRLRGRRGRVENGYVHAIDWAPTILDFAGYDVKSLHLDGISHAKTLFRGHSSHRRGFIVNIDEISRTSAIVLGKWKLIVGSPVYYRPYHKYPTKAYVWLLSQTPFRLFDIMKDPTESRNLAHLYPEIRKLLFLLLQRRMGEVRASVPTNNCPAGNPKFFDGFWSPGWCNNGCSSTK